MSLQLLNHAKTASVWMFNTSCPHLLLLRVIRFVLGFGLIIFGAQQNLGSGDSLLQKLPPKNLWWQNSRHHVMAGYVDIYSLTWLHLIDPIILTTKQVPRGFQDLLWNSAIMFLGVSSKWDKRIALATWSQVTQHLRISLMISFLSAVQISWFVHPRAFKTWSNDSLTLDEEPRLQRCASGVWQHEKYLPSPVFFFGQGKSCQKKNCKVKRKHQNMQKPVVDVDFSLLGGSTSLSLESASHVSSRPLWPWRTTLDVLSWQ